MFSLKSYGKGHIAGQSKGWGIQVNYLSSFMLLAEGEEEIKDIIN
jgi:hypothetical protein